MIDAAPGELRGRGSEVACLCFATRPEMRTLSLLRLDGPSATVKLEPLADWQPTRGFGSMSVVWRP